MTQPEWGIFPEDTSPKLFWGARAIITRGYVDLLPDRQSFISEDDSRKEAFVCH